jgi:hypothetical protein
MSKAWVFFLLLVLGTMGCVSHFFVDSDLRIQVINRSSRYAVRYLELYATVDSLPPIGIMEQEVMPGQKTRVNRIEWTGSLYTRIQYRDTSCASESCWVDNDLGLLHWEQGSRRLLVLGRDSAAVEFILD